MVSAIAGSGGGQAAAAVPEIASKAVAAAATPRIKAAITAPGVGNGRRARR
jgi:hypothetical protein